MSASEQSMEHRWGTRVALNESAAVRSDEGGEGHAMLRNASLSGAFVETAERPALLSRLAVRPTVGNLDWIEAWVVRTDDCGMALEWLEPASRTVVALLSSARLRELSGTAKISRLTLSTTHLEQTVHAESVIRAQSEIDSDEYDLQG